MYSYDEVMTYCQEEDVKFIRLAFCDIFGVQKNIAIMASQLPAAIRQGISFDASAIRGFSNVEESDLFLIPACMACIARLRRLAPSRQEAAPAPAQEELPAVH